MTLQEKFYSITPYQEDDFITVNTEYDFSFSINFWQHKLPIDLIIPDEFKEFINIKEETSNTELDTDLIKKETWYTWDDFSAMLPLWNKKQCEKHSKDKTKTFDWTLKEVFEEVFDDNCNFFILPRRSTWKSNYVFYAMSREDEKTNINLRDDIDLVLDKVIEFLDYCKILKSK